MGHGVAVAYDEDFRSFPERVFRSQGHQPVVANHAGDHAVQAVQQLAVRNVLAYQVGLCDADKAGNDADLLPGMHGFGLFVEVKAQQARQKLDEIRPLSIGQAGRISGVSPSDIAVLLIWLSQHEQEA